MSENGLFEEGRSAALVGQDVLQAGLTGEASSPLERKPVSGVGEQVPTVLPLEPALTPTEDSLLLSDAFSTAAVTTDESRDLLTARLAAEGVDPLTGFKVSGVSVDRATNGLVAQGITLRGSGQSDALFLSVAKDGQLAYSRDGDRFGAVSSPESANLFSSNITVDLAAGDDRLVVDQLVLDALQLGGGRLNFVGGAGQDQLSGTGADAQWTVTGRNRGVLGEVVSFRQTEQLVGAADTEDTFIFEEAGRLDGGIDGGAGGFDSLVVRGGSYKDALLTWTNSDSGSVVLGDNTIQYAGLEPIDLRSEVTIENVTLDLSLLDQPISVDGGRAFSNANALLSAGNTPGEISLSGTHTVSNVNPPIVDQAFESVVFNAPTNALTVKLGGGDDRLEIEGLDGFSGALNVQGDEGNDEIVVTGAIDLNNALSIDGGDGDDRIVLRQAITAQGLNITGGKGLDFVAFESDVTLPGQALTVDAENIGAGFAIGESTRLGVGVRDARTSDWTASQTYDNVTAFASSGGGTGMQVKIVVDDEGTPVATLVNAGTGYKVGDTVTFNDPTGTGSAITLNVLSAATGPVTISTQTADGSGTAGAVNLTGEMISLGNATVQAGSTAGAAGAVTFQVQQTGGFDALDILADVDATLVGIRVGNQATVRGGDVAFRAIADHSKIVGQAQNGNVSGKIQ
ncbi:MAG: hypothetical protein AAFU53_03705, partial [Cyanobacteria bacterium J06632_3]